MKSKRIRILHILGLADRGGTEANTYALVTRMSRDFQSEIFFLNEPGPIGERLERNGFQVCYSPLSGLRSVPRTLLSLWRLCSARSVRVQGRGVFVGR